MLACAHRHTFVLYICFGCAVCNVNGGQSNFAQQAAAATITRLRLCSAPRQRIVCARVDFGWLILSWNGLKSNLTFRVYNTHTRTPSMVDGTVHSRMHVGTYSRTTSVCGQSDLIIYYMMLYINARRRTLFGVCVSACAERCGVLVFALVAVAILFDVIRHYTLAP